MNRRFSIAPPQLGAVTLLHQEGLFGLVALVGLAMRDPGPLAALDVKGSWWIAAAAGVTVAGVCLLTLRLLLVFPAVQDLEQWQAALVMNWTVSDAVAVALLSGLCEEALVRALLQPWIGLVPAALIFAALHVVPDRRLWIWPLVAFVMGLLFGVLFEHWGYPAAALAHFLMNLASLLRLRRFAPIDD